MNIQSYLKKHMRYDENTGHCYWIMQTRGRHLGKPIGTLTNNGYLVASVLGKTHTLHRIIWIFMTGEIPEQVDHINSVRTDNRWKNLRVCTASENQAHSKRKRAPASGYRGVSWEGDKWLASITKNKKNMRLGRFVCKIEAAKAYDVAAKKLFKDFAVTNFG